MRKILIPLMLAVFVLGSTAQASKLPYIFQKNFSVDIGKKFQLTVKNYKGKVKWHSANPKVARVNSKGIVTGKRKGKTYIIGVTKKGKVQMMARCSVPTVVYCG